MRSLHNVERNGLLRVLRPHHRMHAVQLAAATPVPTLRIFISSGDDAADLRERVAGLIEKAVNSQLRQLDIDLQLQVDRWEDTAPDTNEAGERTNERFVKRALDCDLLDALDPSAIRHFDREMKMTMYRALGDDSRLLSDGGRLLPFAAVLAPRREWDRLRRLLKDPSPKYTRVISRLRTERPEIVSSAVEARTLSALVGSLREQSEEARRGTTALGGAGPRIELGRFLSVCEKPDRAAVQLLIETAIDPTLPSPYLREARQGLVFVRRAGRLPVSGLRALRSAPDSEPAPHPEDASPALLRAFLLLVCAERSTGAERTELVAMVRSPEERVRVIAASACAEALSHAKDEGLAWALVSGLFDPSPAVCGAALAGLPSLDLGYPAAADVAWQRLPALFEQSTRAVRAEIVHALGATPPRGASQRRWRAELLRQARLDRSWQVRDAAAQVEKRSR
jgi:hypothetical protein